MEAILLMSIFGQNVCQEPVMRYVNMMHPPCSPYYLAAQASGSPQWIPHYYYVASYSVP